MYLTRRLNGFDGVELITIAIVKGTLYIAITLSLLLLVHDVALGSPPQIETYIGWLSVIYLFFTLRTARRKQITLANWLLIGLYQIITTTMLLYWGHEFPIVLLCASFTLLLPGILLAPKHLLTVAIAVLATVTVTHILHSTKTITPLTRSTEEATSLFDIIAYTAVLAAFALVSWVSLRQTTVSLARAKKAEGIIRKQKDQLTMELARQSAELRQAQVLQMEQLYRFAIIGQSAAATLHELSNHLSILNLDMSDLKQQHAHSKSIANAEESMNHINQMVKRVRSQLNSKNISEKFKPAAIVQSTINDIKHQHGHGLFKIKFTPNSAITKIRTFGDPSSLMQIVTILINNALDACREISSPLIEITASTETDHLVLAIKDNGAGVSGSVRTKLFQPVQSMKPSGLGVGLYIANHLAESHLRGTLRLLDSKTGAHFELRLPLPKAKS